tara:strand:+ start:57 stop:284 length:228 start_codon:yes stop_codon:yes gene_type:complete
MMAKEGEQMDDSQGRFRLRLLRYFLLLILVVLGLAILSMINEGWLFGGVSFQQTTVGSPLWYIGQRLLDSVYPST